VDPVGQQMLGGVTVIGVVGQARIYDVHQDGRPQLYMRNSNQFFQRPLYYVIATQRDPETLVPELRSALRSVDPRIAMGEPRSLDEIVQAALRQERAGAVLISAFALGAVLLVTMGIFGVVASSVTRRHHELAVRLTVGADHRRVLRLVLGDAGRLVVVGVLLGLPGIYATSGLLRGSLVGISPSDPLTLVVVSVKLALITLATGYVAARRVLKIDPAQMLQVG
jgi:ABC-type antimicrobial peptide transport system permease subunit